MSGATFPWTFNQAFEIRTAPPLDTTNVSQQGRKATGVSQQGTRTTEVSHQ